MVWPNGTLASAAIGNFMSILTLWNTQLKPPLFLEYDGNRMRLAASSKLAMLEGHECPPLLRTRRARRREMLSATA